MDNSIRELEREAASGDSESQIRLKHLRCRSGVCCAHSTGRNIPYFPNVSTTAELIFIPDPCCNELTGEPLFPSTEDEKNDYSSKLHLTITLSGFPADINEVANKLSESFQINNPIPINRTCPHCNAKPGEACKTKSGREAEMMHIKRRYVFQTQVYVGDAALISTRLLLDSQLGNRVADHGAD